MKINILTLVASALIMTAANAQSLTPNEIFSAIDGEYNHVADNEQRVNFDMSDVSGNASNVDNILSGIDGEYSRGNTSRINYSLHSSDTNDIWTVNSVLSGIDGEYYQ